MANFRRNNESIQELSHRRTSSPDSIDSNLSELNIDEEQSTSGLLGSPSTDSDDNNAGNNNNGDNKSLLMKNPLNRLPFAAPNLLPPLPPQFQFGIGSMMAAQAAMNNQTNKSSGMPGQMNMEAMQHFFMQSPLFQHFQKQFLMNQQLFMQQQFLMQQNVQPKSTTNGTSAKTSALPAQKRNKLSIDEILKQRVKPTNVATETDDQNPTDTSGSNGIGDEDEPEMQVKGETVKTEEATCSQA